MQIWLQPDKLADLGLTVKDIQNALKDQQGVGGGCARSGSRRGD